MLSTICNACLGKNPAKVVTPGEEEDAQCVMPPPPPPSKTPEKVNIKTVLELCHTAKVPRDVKHLSCLYKRKGISLKMTDDKLNMVVVKMAMKMLYDEPGPDPIPTFDTLRMYRVAEGELLTLLSFHLNLTTRYDRVLEWHYGDNGKNDTFVRSDEDTKTLKRMIMETETVEASDDVAVKMVIDSFVTSARDYDTPEKRPLPTHTPPAPKKPRWYEGTQEDPVVLTE